MNNKIINNNQSKTVLVNNNINKDIGGNAQLMPIEQGRSEKIINITSSINTSDQPLITREIENSSKLSISENQQTSILTTIESTSTVTINEEMYNEQKASLLYLMIQVGALGEFIKEHINSNYPIKNLKNIAQDITMVSLMHEKYQLNDYILKNSKDIKRYNEFIRGPIYNKARNSLDNILGLEKGSSVHLTLFIFEEIFTKTLNWVNERRQISISLNSFKKAKVIKGLDEIIKKSISDFTNIMSNKYHYLLPILLNLEDSINVKLVTLSQYIGLLPPKCELNIEMLLSIRKDAQKSFAAVSYISNYMTRLQHMIDLFAKAQKSPKTMQTLELLLAESTKHLEFYKKNNFQRAGIKNCANDFDQGYNSINSTLEKLIKELYSLKLNEVWADSPVAKVNKKQLVAKKKVQKQSVQKKVNSNQIAERPENLQVNSIDLPKAKSEGKLESGQVDQGDKENIAPKANENALSTSLQNDIQKPAPDTSKMDSAQIKIEENQLPKKGISEIKNEIISIEIKEEDSENVERETNELLELVFNWIGIDQKAKSELKEQKKQQEINKRQAEKQQAKQPLEAISEKKPVVIELKDEQATFDAIFSEKTCHLILRDSEIKSLITKLKGRVERGEKNKWNIFWGSLQNKHKSGEYEVNHDGDKNGFLKKKWVKRVAMAIYDGVKRGYIAEEMIPKAWLELHK